MLRAGAQLGASVRARIEQKRDKKDKKGLLININSKFNFRDASELYYTVPDFRILQFQPTFLDFREQ